MLPSIDKLDKEVLDLELYLDDITERSSFNFADQVLYILKNNKVEVNEPLLTSRINTFRQFATEAQAEMFNALNELIEILNEKVIPVAQVYDGKDDVMGVIREKVNYSNPHPEGIARLQHENFKRIFTPPVKIDFEHFLEWCNFDNYL